MPRLCLELHNVGFAHLRRWSPTAVRPHWRLYWNPTPGARIRYEATDYHLDRASCLLMPPNTPFEQVLLKPFDTLFIHFSLGRPRDRLHGRAYAGAVGPHEQRALQRLGAAARECPAAPSTRFQAARFVFDALAAVPDRDWPREIPDPRIRAVVAVLEQAPADPRPDADLARRAHLSVNAFIRAFRRSLGTTPQAYLRNLRLNRAERLLLASDRSVEEIATACGFANRHYFTRVFAGKHRCGPATYRRRSRESPS